MLHIGHVMISVITVQIGLLTRSAIDAFLGFRDRRAMTRRNRIREDVEFSVSHTV